jgi:hypothetical protein
MDKEVDEKPKRWWKQLYATADPKAHIVKAIGQMLIGAGIATLLAIKAFGEVTGTFPPFWIFAHLDHIPTLKLVASGLAYAAGLELAFMLFTDGPDEAIHPLILGLASAAILEISHDKLNVGSVVAVVAFALTIGFLLWLGERFIKPEDE